MSNAQAIRYLSDAEITDDAFPTVAPMYESLEALQASLDNQAVLMDFGNPGSSHGDLRALLHAGINGTDGQTAEEQLYLLTPIQTNDSGSVAIMVEPIGSITWTAGANAMVGGRAGEKIPKALTATDNGRLATRTGFTIDGASAEPAVGTVYDKGPSQYVLRVPRVGDAAGISPMGAAWR